MKMKTYALGSRSEGWFTNLYHRSQLERTPAETSLKMFLKVFKAEINYICIDIYNTCYTCEYFQDFYVSAFIQSHVFLC